MASSLCIPATLLCMHFCKTTLNLTNTLRHHAEQENLTVLTPALKATLHHSTALH